MEKAEYDIRVADILRKYTPATRTVRILLDGSIQAEIDDVRARLKHARRAETLQSKGLRTQIPDLEVELAKLEQRADENATVFVIRAIPGADFDKLKLDNPPTEAQWKRFREQQQTSPLFAQAPEFDPDSLAPPLIARSIAEVDGHPVAWSDKDGAELWSTLHDGARADLLTAAWEVNGQRSARPLYETATDTTPNSGPESTT